MANYTGQFNHHNPLEFRPSMSIPTWPAILLQDARSLLKGFSLEDLHEIALALENSLVEFSQPYNFPLNKKHWIWSRVLPWWTSDESIKTSESIRKNFDDLNLFIAFFERREFHLFNRRSINVTEWQALVLLAIWKLIDAYEVIYKPSDDGAAMVNRKPIEIMDIAGALAMEAQAAVARTVQIKLRIEHVKEQLQSRAQIDELTRKLNSSKGGKTKRANSQSIRDEVLLLISVEN